MSGSVRPIRCAEHDWVIGAASRRAGEVLSATDERRLLRHLAVCPSCLEAAVAEDQALFFVPLARSFAPQRSSASEARDGRKMASDVLAVIEAERLDRRLRPPRLLLRAAAVVLAGAGLAGLLLIRHGWQGSGRPPAAEEVAAATAAPSRAVAAASVPLVEEVACRDAKIYQFAPEAAGQQSVVFVVDRNADL